MKYQIQKEARRPRAYAVPPQRLPLFLYLAAMSALVGLASLPLVWTRLATIGDLTVGPFHIAFACTTVFVVLGSKRRCLRRLIRENAFLLVATLVFLLAMLLVFLIGNLQLRNVVRPFIYAVFGYAVGLLVTDGRLRIQQILALAAPVAVGLFLLSFFVAAVSSGASVVMYLVLAIKTADPDILIFRVFRTIIATGGEALPEARANLRHDIGLGLLFCGVISMTFLRSQAMGALRTVILVATGLTLLIAIVTLSRATIVIGLLSAVYIALGRAGTAISFQRVLLLLALPCLGLAVLFATPLGDLVVSRFAQSESYDARGQATRDSLAVIADNPLFPSDGAVIDLIAGNSHNVLLESWKYGGAAGAFAAFLMIAAVVGAMLRGVLWMRRISVTPRRGVSPDILFASSLLVFPFVRYFSSGGGLGMPSWAAIGVAAGCFAVYRQLWYESRQPFGRPS